MLNLIKRYGTWSLLAVILAGVIVQPDLFATLCIATVAVLQAVILADVVQWIYTGLRWTDTHQKMNDPEINEIVVAGKMRVLGNIYLGTAILVGLVYYAVYFVQRVPA